MTQAMVAVRCIALEADRSVIRDRPGLLSAGSLVRITGLVEPRHIAHLPGKCPDL